MSEHNTNVIRIRGAWENNLKHIDLDIPKGKIVAFVGVSGSGKSSIVFDTIAAESMRQLYETFPVYVRNRMPYYPAPKAEEIRNLTTAIVVDQRPVTGDVRSTVGTMTDISPMLRLLFSRFADGAAGSSGAYSFNDPEGMCPVCAGLGSTLQFDLDLVLDRDRSLNEEAIRLPGFQINSYQWQMYANSGWFDNDKPLRAYSGEEWERFLHGKDHVVDIQNHTGHVWDDSYKLTYEGLLDRINRLYLEKKQKTVSKSVQNVLDHFTIRKTCPACEGRRLNPQALSAVIARKSIWDLGQMEITELISFLKDLPAGSEDRAGLSGEDAERSTLAGAAELIRKIVRELTWIEEIGLGYLSLNRTSSTLSGGEAQRLKIVKHLGSSLTGVTYIFDEPSTGLHPADIARLNRLLLALKERGNTVLVVEHDRDVIRAADEVIELGPGAGRSGGSVIYQGAMTPICDADTPTGRWLRTSLQVKQHPRSANGWLTLRECRENNLTGFDVRIPRGVLTAVTGPAGSGKSSLACEELPRQYPGTVHISQAPVGTNIRSNPASYVGIMDEIRKLFAKANHTSAGLYSFNAKGACPVCGGKGIVVTEMAFMDPVTTQCEACGGLRYNPEALAGKLNGKTIAEVLAMTVAEALDFFEQPRIVGKLKLLQEVGLDYLTLGQPTSTLSGGECQRIKLAAHLKNRDGIYVLDEPAAGLHGQDIVLLMRLLNRLADRGNTVVVVEHKYDIISGADWIIDLGPGGGRCGGSVIYEGPVSGLISCTRSKTGRYLSGENLLIS